MWAMGRSRVQVAGTDVRDEAFSLSGKLCLQWERRRAELDFYRTVLRYVLQVVCLRGSRLEPYSEPKQQCLQHISRRCDPYGNQCLSIQAGWCKAGWLWLCARRGRQQQSSLCPDAHDTSKRTAFPRRSWDIDMGSGRCKIDASAVGRDTYGVCMGHVWA